MRPARDCLQLAFLFEQRGAPQISFRTPAYTGAAGEAPFSVLRRSRDGARTLALGTRALQRLRLREPGAFLKDAAKLVTTFGDVLAKEIAATNM